MVRETGAMPAEDFLTLYRRKEGGLIEYQDLDERKTFYSLNGGLSTRREIQQLIKEGVMRRGRGNKYLHTKGTPTPI